MGQTLILLLFVVVLFHTIHAEDTIKIEVPKNASTKEVFYYKQIRLAPNSTIKIHVSDIMPQYFAILQAHSHIHNISLNALAAPFSYTSGTNIGFTLHGGGEFELRNWKRLIEIDAAVALIIYNKSVTPIPGACRGPELHLRETRLIRVATFPAGNWTGKRCRDGGNYTYELRYRYMSIGDMSSMTYFTGIRQMMDVGGAVKFGRENVLADDLNGTYVGVKRTLMIFQSIVDGRAAYIPVATYSCNSSLWGNDCYEFAVLHFVFYVALMVLAVIFSVRTLIPPSVPETLAVMSSGIVLSVIIMADSEFTALGIIVAITASLLTSARFPEFRTSAGRTFVTFFISWICLVSLFYTANVTYNLLEYQYGFILLFTLIGCVALYKSQIRDTPLYIFLACFLHFFSLSYLTRGQIYVILEHIYFLRVDSKNNTAIRRLLIAPQDGLIFSICLIIGVISMAFYRKFGEIWLEVMQRQHEYKMHHPEVCTIEERMLIATENAPLITRYTEDEEDDVFESPNTSHLVYSRVRKTFGHVIS